MQIDFINYPFTRILDRLLGPCFKTGPKGIPNLTAVDQTIIEFSSNRRVMPRDIINNIFKIHQTVITGNTQYAYQTIHTTVKDHAICSDKLHIGLLMTQYTFCMYQFLMDHGVLLREKCTLRLTVVLNFSV